MLLLLSKTVAGIQIHEFIQVRLEVFLLSGVFFVVVCPFYFIVIFTTLYGNNCVSASLNKSKSPL